MDVRVFGGYEGRLDNNGEILRLKDAGPEYPATVDFLRYGDGGEWPEGADGLGHSIELTEVTPFRDNDEGSRWRRSLAPGGSPGHVDGITAAGPNFRRGEVVVDGVLNVTDAIGILRHLFAGGGAAACAEALDVDANAEIQLSDAIFLLRYLFVPAAPAIAGSEACIPSVPGTCEASNCEA